MKLKKVVTILILFVLIIGHGFVFADEEYECTDLDCITLEPEDIINVAGATSEGPEILSKSAVIFDRVSGEIIWGKNEHVQMAMASTTKILTAILLIENGDLDETVTVERTAAAIGGSRLGLNTDDKITMRDLLYGLMLKSRQ